MKRHIKQEKLNEFLQDFYNNSGKWYKDQIENDWEFDEETQLKIVQFSDYNKNEDPLIKFIKNPTKYVVQKQLRIMVILFNILIIQLKKCSLKQLNKMDI